jgi:hypothetical protein
MVGAVWLLQAFLLIQNMLTETRDGSLLYRCWIKALLPITNTAGDNPDDKFNP